LPTHSLVTLTAMVTPAWQQRGLRAAMVLVVASVVAWVVASVVVGEDGDLMGTHGDKFCDFLRR
jgi:hypothetical protein